jgi:hypothetical protein
MLSKLFNLAAVLAATVAITACGGGGGGGSSVAAPAPTAFTPPIGSGTPNAIPTVVVSGTASYEAVPYLAIARTTAPTADAGSLDFANVTAKPIRGATVQAFSGSTVFSSAVTSSTGSYTLTVPQNQAYTIRVLAELVKTTGTATWDIAVYDNTNSNSFWVLTGTPGFTGTTNTVRNIVASTGWTGSGYGPSRASGIFAILDTIYAGLVQIQASGGATSVTFPALSVFWSPNNINAAGSRAVGQLGGKSFFTSSANASGVIISRSMYILGKADNDSDEHDSGIIAHEFGHYLQSAFSSTNSVGGSHSTSDKLDMTLAFSEGFGNAYSAIVRNDPIIADSGVLATNQGYTYGIADSTTWSNPGWFNEDSVANVMYTFVQSQGFRPFWAALTGPMKNLQDSLATVFSFADAVRTTSPASVSVLGARMVANNINAPISSNVQWGVGETSGVTNSPVYTQLTVGAAAVNVCPINVPGTANNKLDEIKYFRFTATGGNHTITVTSTPGATTAQDHDMDIYVFQKGILKGFAETTSATIESLAATNIIAGEVVIRIKDYNLTTAANTCSTIAVN